jgi:hypothetical protein
MLHLARTRVLKRKQSHSNAPGMTHVLPLVLCYPQDEVRNEGRKMCSMACISLSKELVETYTIVLIGITSLLCLLFSQPNRRMLGQSQLKLSFHILNICFFGDTGIR